MKVLIIGSGGREHALAWSCARSSLHPILTCVPGNGGTANIARNVEISADDIDQIEDYVRAERFDLTVIGPEAPAIAGLADRLSSRGFPVFGPSANAARIEGSKAFAKRLMQQTGVPTADFDVFTSKVKADAYIRSKGAPIVVKASGIAAGKGAIVCQTVDEALNATKAIFDDRLFGAAGDEVVIEEFSHGREVSLTAIVDGRDFLLLPPSRDHKRIFDGDKGPNTGGMGVLAPVSDVSDELFARFASQVLPPLLKGLADAGTPFKGVVYPGLMVENDKFVLLEVNARFGDPETQALLPLLKPDLLEIMAEVADGGLGKWIGRNSVDSYDWRKISLAGASATVVASAPGYPGSYPKGITITSLPQETDNLVPFHAGTSKRDGGYATNGGRVLAITGLGKDAAEAIDIAYDGMSQVKFEGIHYRKDIGRTASF